jgi:hypothetical protein
MSEGKRSILKWDTLSCTVFKFSSIKLWLDKVKKIGNRYLRVLEIPCLQGWPSDRLFKCFPPSRLLLKSHSTFFEYSQTWTNNHLRIATTILRSHLELLLLTWPLNNDHLSTTATIFGSQGWSLYTGLTVHVTPSVSRAPLEGLEGLLPPPLTGLGQQKLDLFEKNGFFLSCFVVCFCLPPAPPPEKFAFPWKKVCGRPWWHAWKR